MPVRDVKYSAPASVSVGTSTTVVLAENGARTYLLLVNDSDTTIYLAVGAPAVVNKGIRVNANGGAFEMIRDVGGNFSHQAVNAISSAAGKNLTIQEATQG